MFRKVTLKNFRQHTDLTIEFMNGVVAIRGRNEGGKTTILEAMGYGLFGATSLREPVEDTVTWGKKPGDLKVIEDFHLNGIDYTVTRGKSGAEIKSGAQLLAHGQKEVTRYIETLLGASADVCTKLMMASQDDIKGALSKGPTAAIELIEALSDLSVIDKIIGLVQEKLPSGSTVATVARVAALEAQVAVDIVDETGDLRAASTKADATLDAADLDLQTAKDAYDAAQPDAVEAQKTVDAHTAAQAALQRANSTHVTAQQRAVEFVVPEAPTVERIEELRKVANDAGLMLRARKAVETLEGLVDLGEETHQGGLADVQTYRSERDAEVKAEGRERVSLQMEIVKLRGQKITQTACGLCGKDLSKVPEVVTKNAELDERIAKLQEQVATHKATEDAAMADVTLCEKLLAADATNRRLQAQAAGFTTLIETTVPCGVAWTGPADIVETTGNETALLAAAETQVRVREQAVGQKTQIEAALKTAEAALLAAQTTVTGLEVGLEDRKEYLLTTGDLLVALSEATGIAQTQRRATEQARQALNQAEAVHRERVTAREALEKQLSNARVELVEMDDNNALIKFLREARPIITDQLWNIVTATVSSYFSDIRGTQSVVTREDNGFKVDGHNIAGLSGSTKDALGLAIRKALTKTFLPNASFMILDEPAAACDDERESNMLGLIASGGFEQVLLVTHSDLADSFATQVVQL